jgi:hypothetical protein
MEVNVTLGRAVPEKGVSAVRGREETITDLLRAACAVGRRLVVFPGGRSTAIK